MVNIHENSKDWFEFILDLDLLDNYFKNEKKNNDTFGNSLIIQFLYHANMTEQVYANPLTNGNKTDQNNTSNVPLSATQGEFKCKRIKILRILAIKTACLLNWNLLKFEKDIPVAVMSDLLHIFLRYTMEYDEQKMHSQLDIDKLDAHSLFALQLLHRWCIRIIVYSKYLKRPPNKSAVINVPGIVNPLQHMKDANENILKVLINNVQESVDFLEKCLDCLTHDVCIPTSDCFTNLSAETGSYDIVWEKANFYSINVIKCLISFDLGVYYFQQENYQNSFKHLKKAEESNNLISTEDPNQDYLKLYLIELKSYLLACGSMLDESVDVSITENVMNNNLKKIVYFEKNPNDLNIQSVAEVLNQDNSQRKLSQSLRLNLEASLQKSENSDVYQQVCEMNLIRLIMDSSYFSYSSYKKVDLNNIIKILNNVIKKLPFQSRNNINAFLELNSSTSIEKSLPELNNFDIKFSQNRYKSLGDLGHSFNTIEKSTNIKSDLMYKKHLLQTSQSKEIVNCVSNNSVIIQSDKYKNKLKYFWSKWEPHAQPLLFMKARKTLTNEILEKIFVSTEKQDVQFYFISIAKLFELVRIKKFDAAYFILKNMEQKGFKNGRFLSDMALYVNVSKISNELDFSESRAKRKIKPNIEKKIHDAKEFFNNHKNFAEIPAIVCRTVLSFLISVEEYEYLKDMPIQEINQTQSQNQNKKQRIDAPIKNANYSIIEICKNVAKLCIEIEKNERIQSRKTAREIWDGVIEVFSDISPPKRSNAHQDAQTNFPLNMNSYQASIIKETQHSLTREALRNFLLFLKNPLVSSLLISLLSTIYNIGESMVNNEIFSEFRYLWPSSMANSNSLNINSVLDLLNSALANYVVHINPFNSYILRTIADINLASANYFDAFKYYLQIFVCETKFFIRRFESKNDNDGYSEDYFDKSLKSMIKCCFQMNKHTHAALLSQMTDGSQDYLNVFRGLQDRSVLIMDEMDSLYDCLWDINLLEFLTYMHASRGQIDKRNKCLKLTAAKCINSANSNDIFEKTVEAKKKLLFSNLIKYYITI